MIYYLYKTTNLINNKIYIGARSYNGDDINKDKYLGSGKLILLAIQKYGKQNFKKEILYICNDRQQLYIMQKNIVNQQFVKKIDTYNMCIGGSGGDKVSGRIRINKNNKNKMIDSINLNDYLLDG